MQTHGPCTECAAMWQEDLGGVRSPLLARICPACMDAKAAVRDREAQEEAERRHRAGWNAICPPGYRDIDLANPNLSLAARKALEAWRYEPDCGHGLGIVGRTGLGKTRLVFWRLRQIYLEQRIVPHCISSVRLEKALHGSFSDDLAARYQSESILERCHDSAILFVDDIGKEKFTERLASHFYALVEHRTSHLLPIIWTTNMTAHDLNSRLGDDKGEPTLRRLKEFSTIVGA